MRSLLQFKTSNYKKRRVEIVEENFKKKFLKKPGNKRSQWYPNKKAWFIFLPSIRYPQWSEY